MKQILQETNIVKRNTTPTFYVIEYKSFVETGDLQIKLCLLKSIMDQFHIRTSYKKLNQVPLKYKLDKKCSKRKTK
jgi:hypothetical protein